MDCRDFQRIHPDMLDEALPALELVQAHRHMLECEKCANQDASVRRALLVFRNLRPIEPSSQFSQRLNKRLAATRDQQNSIARIPLIGVFAAAAGLVVMVTIAGGVKGTRHDLTMPAVVATLPEQAPSQFVTPTLAASMSAGFPVWPALLMAEHASQQLADAEFKFAAYNPR